MGIGCWRLMGWCWAVGSRSLLYVNTLYKLTALSNRSSLMTVL